MSESTYSIYASIAEQNQAILPDLIRKYESVEFINSNWSKYDAMFDDATILKILVNKCHSLLLSVWQNFNQEKAFQKVFRLFLENPNSAYYSEIKEPWNSYSLGSFSPINFDNSLVVINIMSNNDINHCITKNTALLLPSKFFIKN